MPLAPYDLSISAARADALFASPLQRSDEPSARQVRQAIATAIAAYGVRGCAARVAQDYGDHPETAHTRLRGALTAAASASGGSQAEPAHPIRDREAVPALPLASKESRCPCPRARSRPVHPLRRQCQRIQRKGAKHHEHQN